MFRTTCASASTLARLVPVDRDVSRYGTLGVLVASLAVLLVTMVAG